MAPAALAAKGSYRPEFLAAIDACLRVKQGDRPQSVAQLRSMLLEPLIETQQLTSKSVEITPSSQRTSRKAGQRKIGRWPAPAAAIMIVALGAYGGYELTRRQRNDAVESATGLARTGHPMGSTNPDERQDGLEEERVAAEKAAPRKAPAEAEEIAKDEERRRTASRQEPTRPAPPSGSIEQPKPLGHLINLSVKLGNQPTDENKPWLGVDTEPLELALALSLGLASPNGALIFDKTADGPADRADIRIGDVIVAMNGAIANTSDLHSRLSLLTSGMEVPLELWRAAEKYSDFVLTLRQLADGGNGQAIFWLGRMYAGGIGTTRDDIEAVSWYRRGAEAGNMDATAALGIALLAGRGVAIDRQEGLRLIRAAAATDQVEAMNRLGQVLLEGKIADKDQHDAVHLFTKAAEAGHAPSMVVLGRLYANGIGVQADPRKAEIWYRQAAQRGHAGGTAGLGSLYENGMGVEMDFPRAAALYRRAADLGNAGAMANLGQLYAQGKGVAKSEDAAIDLFRKAANLGNSNAMNNLAWMLQNGAGGLRKDPDEAAKLMLNAIDRGSEFSLKQMTLNSRA